MGLLIQGFSSLINLYGSELKTSSRKIRAVLLFPSVRIYEVLPVDLKKFFHLMKLNPSDLGKDIFMKLLF